MKTPSHLIALSFALTAAPLWAVPVELARESFEGAAGAIGFTTSVAPFDEPSVATSDFFSVIPNNGTRLTGGTISGGDGPNMFAAEDIDTAPGLLAPTQSLTTNAFSIAGKSNLSVRILLAAPGTGPATGGVQTFYDHSNTASEIDFVKVEASVDGGPFAPLIQFSPTTAAPEVNATLSLDTDFNGLGGQGTVLTAAFQDFTLPIATGSSVQVRVSMHSNATNEYICIDNLRIFGEIPTTAAPVLGGMPGTALAFTEGGAAAAVAPALTVADPDSANLTGATVTISQNYATGEDVLAATASGGLTVAFTPSTGVLTLSGTASKAVYQTVLQSVTYRNTHTSAPNPASRQIRFSTTDGVNASNQPIREVTVTDNLITQTLPFTESFETDGRGSRYALDGRFTSSAASYFDRQTTVPSVTNPDGTAALVGEDTETNAAPLKAVRFQLNTSGFLGNQAVIRLGAPAGAVFDTGDLLAVEASVDGGAWTPAGIFRSTGSGSTPLALDTNGDGLGDGTTLLSAALQDFTFPLPAATTLGLRIRLVSNSATEQMVVDRIVVSGTLAPIVSNTNDSGPGSLRQALSNAAAIAGPNTVTFVPGLSTIILSSEIVITDTAGVTLNAGNYPSGIVIDGGPGTNRLFRIDPGTSVTLQRLKLTGGNGVGGGAPFNYGGAIHSAGNLTLSECTLSGNASGVGAALFNQSPGVLTIDRSTISGNSATNIGGAIQNEATLAATASTFANNAAVNEGGAISAPFSKPVSLKHCTVSGNAVTSPTGNSGGIKGAALSIENSIISNNTATTDPNLTAGFTGTGFNLIGGTPLLAPLDNYGGPTQTMALRPGSPARNAATTSTATSDQRGFPIVGARDIGAYEAGNALFTNYNIYIQETLPANATDPQHAAAFDFDSDGMNNQDEFLFGTAAESAISVFRPLVTKDGGDILINFPAILGRTYTLQRSDTLAPGSWAPTGLNFSGTGTAGFRLPTTTPARRYFRVEVSR